VLKFTSKAVRLLSGEIKDTQIKELLKGSSLSLVIKIGGVAASYVLSLLISMRYGAKGFGIYSLSLTVLWVLGLTGLMGFNLAVLRFIPQFISEDNLHKIKVLYKDILQLTAPISLFLSIFLYIFSYKIAVVVFNDDSLFIAFRMISFLIPLFVINQINIEVMRAFKHIKLSEYLRNLNVPLFNILFFVFINLLVISYYTAVLSYCFAILISFLLSVYFVGRKLRSIPQKKGGYLSKKELLRISFPMMVTGFMNLIMGNIDTIMLGIFSSTENVGIYNIAFKVASLMIFSLTAINTIVAPMFSELYWSNKMVDLKKVVKFSSKLMFWTSAPLFVVLVVFPEFVLGLFGNEFEIGKNALIILAIGQFINAVSGSVGFLLNMTGKQHIFRNIFLIATLINLILNFILIPKYGIVGAAIATMTSVVAWNIVSVIYIKLEYNIKTFYLPVVSR
jgi:O-antigen/teichoic acid export membrane protein